MTELLVKAADRDRALALFTRAARQASDCVLRVDGKAITAAMRDEMLAKCVAGQHVELELDVLAYEQKAGVSNRNFTRFRDGALMALGRSGKGMPFLRDHEQDDVLARGGTITESRTEKRDPDDYAIHQKVMLTAPWAVELALRGLLSTVSIGWAPTGDVVCSVHNAAIYTKCYCWPGDRYSMTESDNGEKKLVRDRAGELTAEWIYTAAELVETSAVSVPAVPSAHIETIRAALSAQRPRHSGDDDDTREDIMLKTRLLALLTLAATAGEDEIVSAVEADRAELAIAKAELAVSRAELATFKTEKRKTDEDAFIASAVASGRLAAGDDKQWRELFRLSGERAIALMAERTASSVTPVAAARESGGVLPKDVTPGVKDPAIAAAELVASRMGGGLDGVRKNLLAAGYSPNKVEEMIARHVGGGKAA